MGTNTLTNLTVKTMVMRMFRAYRDTLLGFSGLAINFSGDFSQKGKKIDIPWLNYTAGGYDFSGTYQMGDTDATSKELEITAHKYTSWSLSDTELMDKPMIAQQTFADDKGHELAKLMVAFYLAPLVSANFATAYTGSHAGFDADQIADLGTNVTTLNWPNTSRYMRLMPNYFGNLTKDTKLSDASKSGSTETLRGRRMGGQVYGWDIEESNVIPDNDENVVGFISRPDALALGMRLLDPGESSEKILRYMPFTDPETGISMAYRNWYDPDTGTSKSVIEALGGRRVLNPDALQLIKAA